MHNLSNRANLVFAFLVSAVFAVLAIVAISSPLLLSQVQLGPVVIKTPRVQVSMVRIKQRAHIYFDLEADLRPLFNWNTKQVFVYLVSEYSTPEYGFNQVTIWDDIITDKSEAKINHRQKAPEYPLTDMQKTLEGVQSNLTLRYNVVPWVGAFLDYSAPSSHKFTFPAPSE